MAGAYKRRQLLLRREDGAPGGFVRMEQAGLRLTVEVVAKGVPTTARAVLLTPRDDTPLPLGDLEQGMGTFALRAEQADGHTQAAVLAGDMLALVGGENADFKEIRSRLTRRKYAPKPVSGEPGRDRRDGGAGVANRAVIKASAVPPDEESLALPPESVCEVGALHGGDAEPVSGPRAEPSPRLRVEPSVFTEATGWTFTPHRIPGAPERITGRLVEGGSVKAVLHGIAGMYAPEPPPGLSGYVWDAGYWVRVEKKVCS